MVVNANRLLQEGVVSCAPRTFSRSGKSLSESLSNKEMFAAYGIYVLQRRTEIALVVVFIVVAIVAGWRASNLRKQYIDSTELVLGVLLTGLVIIGIVTACC